MLDVVFLMFHPSYDFQIFLLFLGGGGGGGRVGSDRPCPLPPTRSLMLLVWGHPLKTFLDLALTFSSFFLVEIMF